MRRLVCLLGLAALCRADPASDAADAVLAALKADKAKALQTLAQRVLPDPWLVADELCRRAEFDAAEAFAKAAPRPDTEKLPAYVAARRERPTSTEVRQTLAGYLRGQPAAKSLAQFAALRGPVDTIVAVRLRHGRALLLGKRGEWPASFAGFEEAVGHARKLGWLQRAALVCAHGIDRAWDRDLKFAVKFGESMLAIQRARKDRPGEADVLGDLGALYSRRGRLRKALELQKRSLALDRELNRPRSVAISLMNVGTTYRVLGDLEQAEALLLEGRERLDRLGDVVNSALASGNLGLVYMDRGELEKALASHQRALPALEQARKWSQLAFARRQIGAVYALMGDFPAARENLESAIKLDRAQRNDAGVAACLGTLARLCLDTGELDEALRYEKAALELEKRLGRLPTQAKALINLAAIHLTRGDYAAALRALDQGADLAAKLEGPSLRAQLLVERSRVFQALGDLDRALEQAEEHHALALKVGGDLWIGTALMKLGGIQLARKEYESAAKYLREAVELYGRARMRRAQADALNLLAIAELGAGRRDAALKAASRAVKLSGDVGARAALVSAIGNQASVHTARGELKEAFALRARALDLSLRLGSRYSKALALWGLADLHLRAGDPAESIRLAKQATNEVATISSGLSAEESGGARQRFANLFGVGLSAAHAARDPASFFRFAEQARAYSLGEELRATKRLRDAVIPPELRTRLADAENRTRVAKRRYTRTLQSGKGTGEAWKQLQAAESQLADAFRRLRREAKAQARLLYSEPATLAEFRSTLAPTEVHVLYAVTDEWQAYALVLSPEAVRIVDLGASEALKKAVEAFRRSVSRPDERGMRAPPHEQAPFLARQLARFLIEPLALPAETTRLLVSPDGQLAYVPFTVLAQREVAYLPSASVYRLLRDLKPPERGRRVLALGDPNYATGRDETAMSVWAAQGLAPLPESGREAKAVGDVVLLGKRATIPGLRQALKGQNRWRAVHLACHGLVNPQRPALSSLALSPSEGDQGFLRCLDIYRMKIPADLVVLSACETGKGKIYKAEGVIGWTRAFMFAGAPRVIVSLWKVDDAATRALMEKFYALWKDSKMPAATALKKAQEHVAAQPQWKHPYFWAAWQLWGLGE